MRRALDDDPRTQTLMTGPHKPFLQYLDHITQEYVLLQWRKLHDPPVQQGRVNLSLDYVVQYGTWDAATAARLLDLRNRLHELAAALRDVRNRVLCHYDLATILEDRALGEFPAGTDDEYFRTLQDFVDTVHDAVLGGPYPFPTQAPTDVYLALRALSDDNARRSA